MADDDDNDDEDFILLGIVATCTRILSTQRRSWRCQLTIAHRHFRSSTIRRAALQDPNDSAWTTLFNSGLDDSLITITGFNYWAFETLHQKFAELFNTYTPYNREGTSIKKTRKHSGRKRLLSSRMALGLVLTWARTRGSLYILQLIFGITSSPLSLWLRFSRRLLTLVLLRDKRSKVEMPTREEVDKYSSIVEDAYPSLTRVWGAMDGLKVLIEASTDDSIQRRFYNGWTHDHYITNIFLFAPDGRIRASYINAPGCLHDSTLAIWSGIYDKLNEAYNEHGGRVVVDSAFSRHKGEALIKSYQTNMDRTGRRRQRHRLNKDATSLRQMSEWGMHGLQASFPRLRDRLRYEEQGERKIIMQLIVLLYNFRASTVGQNQIQSVFMPHLERNTNHYMLRGWVELHMMTKRKATSCLAANRVAPKSDVASTPLLLFYF